MYEFNKLADFLVLYKTANSEQPLAMQVKVRIPELSCLGNDVNTRQLALDEFSKQIKAWAEPQEVILILRIPFNEMPVKTYKVTQELHYKAT